MVHWFISDARQFLDRERKSWKLLLLDGLNFVNKRWKSENSSLLVAFWSSSRLRTMLSHHLACCLGARWHILTKWSLSVRTSIWFTYNAISFVWSFNNDANVLNIRLFQYESLPRLFDLWNTIHMSSNSNLLLNLNILFELSFVFPTAVLTQIFFW